MPGPLRLFPQIKGGEQCGDPISGSWGVTKMMSFVSLLLVGILFHATQAEQLTKCEVFQKLKDLKDYGGVSLPECEFPAILLCPIIHPLHSFPPFSSSSFFPSTFNLIIAQFSYLFTLLLHLFMYLSFFPLSDPLELFSPYQDTLWSAIFGDWLESLFLSGNTGPHLCYTWTSLWILFFVFLSGVCTAFHTSGYDTQAIVQNNDSTEYGLFQINNKIWCKDDQNPHSRNICNISCDSEWRLFTLFLCFSKTYSWDNLLFFGVKHTSGFTALASKLTVGLDNTE